GRLAARARTVEVRQQGDHGARQWRMLRFVMVDVLRHVLQPAGDVRRLVARGGEDVGSGYDAADPEQEEAHHQQAGIFRQKGFDAGLPDAGNGGRGRRNGWLDGPGFPGLRGGLFSGQAYAPGVNGWSALTFIV